jgi:hypothetical protein
MPRGLKHVTLEGPPGTVKTPGKKEISSFPSSRSTRTATASKMMVDVPSCRLLL